MPGTGGGCSVALPPQLSNKRAAADKIGISVVVKVNLRIHGHSLNSVPLGEIKCALEGTLFIVDLLLELEDGVENSFGARRAARHVNIDGNDLVAALHDGVIVEDAAGRSASAHGDDPLGLRHLSLKLADDGSHFLREAAGDDHQIGLAGRRAKNF